MYYSGFQCVSESGGGTLANVSPYGCEIGFEQNVSCYSEKRTHHIASKEERKPINIKFIHLYLF